MGRVVSGSPGWVQVDEAGEVGIFGKFVCVW